MVIFHSFLYVYQRVSSGASAVGQSGRCRQEVARILAAGADPNEPDELGETPIFEAWGGDVAAIIYIYYIYIIIYIYILIIYRYIIIYIKSCKLNCKIYKSN